MLVCERNLLMLDPDKKEIYPQRLAIPSIIIEPHIYIVRNHKVMLDKDLALLYEVETKRLNEQVHRNLERFPEDFRFQVTAQECQTLKSQIATSKGTQGGRRFLPYAFTEQGIAMLSSVLKNPKAIHINILIMRAFSQLRQRLMTNEDIFQKLVSLEDLFTNKLKYYDEQMKTIINLLTNQPQIQRGDTNQSTIAPRTIYYGLSASRLQQLSETLSPSPHASCRKCLGIGFRFTDETDSWKRNDMMQCECTG